MSVATMAAARALLMLLAVPLVCSGQEIKYVDLTLTEQRIELRHPPAPTPKCDKGVGCSVEGGIAGGSVADGAPYARDPHALAVSMIDFDSSDVELGRPLTAEFQVLNSGQAPIEIPVWPHLSDLQPADESRAFTYFSLTLAIRIDREADKRYLGSLGFAELYGSLDQGGTMITIKPGEWIRVKARVVGQKLPQLTEPISVSLRGGFGMHKTTFIPHPGGAFTNVQNLYPNPTPTEPLSVRLNPSSTSADAKQ